MSRDVFFKKGSRNTKRYVAFAFASTKQLQAACVAAGIDARVDPKTPLYEALKSAAPNKFHRAMLNDELKKKGFHALCIGSLYGEDTVVGVTEEEWRVQSCKATK